MKLKFIFILLCLSIFFIGCSYVKDDNKLIDYSKDESKTQDQTSNLYLIENTKENIISFQIPLIDEMDEEQILYVKNYLIQKLNKMSGVEFDLSISEKDIQDKNSEYLEYYISMESSVTYASDDLISIVFEGLYNYKEAAHPINWFFTLNFNPKTLERITFAEKYLIDETLYSVFAECAEASIIEECDGVWPEDWGTFSETLCTKDTFIEGMKNEVDFCYYYTQTGVVISYPVAHALGDHKEVEIPYEYLNKLR